MRQSQNRLSQDFTIPTLLKFTAPTAVMLVFMSLYQMVDGAFVSRFVGENALSALNIVYPVPSIMIAFSIMLATGSSAIIAKNMGEGDMQTARENFSLAVAVGLVMGICFLVFGTVFLKPLIQILGATPVLYSYCWDYLLILMLSAPLSVFQMLFQNFFVTAGKPHLGLITTMIGGVSNIVLDYLFIKVYQMGVAGAALATAIGYAIPAIFGLCYFAVNRTGTLYFVKPVLRKQVLLHSCVNGSSEMVNNLAVAITTFLFNTLMLKYAGETGVAAITIVLYAQFLMTAVFMGFSSGIAPVVSYNYGSQNAKQLQKVFRNSMYVVGVISVIVFVLAEFCSEPVIQIFVKPDSEVFQITRHGFGIFSVSFLFTGVNIFASALFTALSNGKVSAILSFLRTFVFLVACLLVLPLFWSINGIWLAVPAAEILAFGVSVFYLVRLRNVYQYAAC